MRCVFSGVPGLFISLAALICSPSGYAQDTPPIGGDFPSQLHPEKLPTDVILVKGAWTSASDPDTPVPEGGKVSRNGFSNPYFGLTYTLPSDWIQKYDGPPPSDSGYYVLAEMQPADAHKSSNRGSVLLTAQDLFFTPTRAQNTLALMDFTKNNLPADYRVEHPPTEIKLADHSFVRFDYVSPVAGLHWRVLATQVRCHVVEFVFTSRDTKVIERLTRDANRMKLPGEASLTQGFGGGGTPMCIQDYARDENILEKVDPVFAQRRFNPVPVRIIIDKKGKVKHIHFLSAFPDQSKGITDALLQWRFEPYLQNGQPVEVETGILFGAASHGVESTPAATSADVRSAQ